jgi:hypothetical protein
MDYPTRKKVISSMTNTHTKIAVISDTHWQPGKPLPKALQLLQEQQPELILHAGDWTDLALLAELEKIAPVQAVAGNCDGGEVVNALGYSRIVEVAGLRLGLTHGHLFSSLPTPRSALRTFADDNVQAVIFGHSHVPYNSTENGVLLFNPGSAVRPLGKVKRPSFGILTLENGQINGEIFYL